MPRVEAYGGTRLAPRYGPWDELFGRWDRALTTLAEEHRSGEARVSPREPEVCTRCHLHALCRVHERRVQLANSGVDVGIAESGDE